MYGAEKHLFFSMNGNFLTMKWLKFFFDFLFFFLNFLIAITVNAI